MVKVKIKRFILITAGGIVVNGNKFKSTHTYTHTHNLNKAQLVLKKTQFAYKIELPKKLLQTATGNYNAAY